MFAFYFVCALQVLCVHFRLCWKQRVVWGKETICIGGERCTFEMSFTGLLTRSSWFFLKNSFSFKYAECQSSVISAKYSQQPKTKHDGR